MSEIIRKLVMIVGESYCLYLWAILLYLVFCKITDCGGLLRSLKGSLYGNISLLYTN